MVQKKKKKKRVRGRVLIFALVLVIVTLLVVFGTHFGGGSLKRIVYMIGSGVSGAAEPATITFDSGDLNKYCAFSGGLAVLGTDGMHIFKMSGKEQSVTPLTYHSPSIAGSKKTVAAYDRGGKNFTVFDNKKVLMKKDVESPIININMNPSGAFAIVTEGLDCKALVTVYNAKLKEIYKLYSAEEFIIDAVVTNDAKKMATLAFSAGSGEFAGYISFYDLGEDKPFANVALPDCMPISARFNTSGELAVLCEDRAIFFDSGGKKIREQSFNGLSIADASLASQKHIAVLLSEYTVGGYAKLMLADEDEKDTKTIDFSEDILGVSSAGNYTAVLFYNKIEVYNSDGTLYNRFNLDFSASSCIMREDGTVLAIGVNCAGLLIP